MHARRRAVTLSGAVKPDSRGHLHLAPMTMLRIYPGHFDARPRTPAPAGTNWDFDSDCDVRAARKRSQKALISSLRQAAR